jgi:kumamolisin
VAGLDDTHGGEGMRWSNSRVGPTAMTVLCTFSVALAAGAATASAASRSAVVGPVPAIPSGARLEAQSASAPMQVTLTLRPRDPAGLQALATAVSTPGSPQFRQYLSVDQFVARFGATAAEIAAVENVLHGAGLSVGTVPDDHLAISATGTTAQVERAFATTESRVRLAGGRTAFTNLEAPRLSSAIADDRAGGGRTQRRQSREAARP